MKRICFLLIYFALLIVLTSGLVGSAVSAQQKKQLQHIQDKIKKIKSRQPKDTDFHFSTGINMPQELIKTTIKTVMPEAKILKVDIDSYYDLKIENIEKRQNKLFTKKGALRKEKILKIDQKHRRYEKLESEIIKNQKRAETEINKLGKKIKGKTRNAKQIKAAIKQKTHIIIKAKVKKQYIRIKKINLGKSRNMAQYMKVRREISMTKRQLNKIKLAKNRGSRFSKGNFLFGTMLTALSSELEENSRADREGRRPLASNKLINFVKNISGYSAVKGVMDSVEISKMEAMVNTMEYYKSRGYDLTDPKVRKMVMERTESAVRRAVVGTAVYEGAKLAPITGDLITIKESFDAAGQAYVAGEEAEFIIANNEQVQFQTSLIAVAKANSILSELKSLVQQVNVITISLNKMGGSLKQFNKHSELNRQKIVDSIQIIDSYNLQAQALQNSDILAALNTDSTAKFKSRLIAIKSSSDEQAKNIKRVNAEYKLEKLTRKAVATQAKFIGDLLQPVIIDYQNLSLTLESIKALNKGVKLADKVPEARAVINQARTMMAKDAKTAAELYDVYTHQADNLEYLLKQYQKIREKIPKLRNHAISSNNLQRDHSDRIMRILDRADNTSLDLRALKHTIANVRRVRNTSERVDALADMDKAPKIVDMNSVKELVDKARQVWEEISGPNQAAFDSLQNSQRLLQELLLLADNANLPDDISDSPLVIESDVKLKGKLFAGKNILHIMPHEITMALTDRTIDRTYINKEFFGFTTPGACKSSLADYCSKARGLYKLLEKGTTTRQWGEKQYRVPYFLVLTLDDFRAELDLSPRWPRKLKQSFRVKHEIKPYTSLKEEIEIIPYSLSNADEALIIKRQGNKYIDIKLFARKAQLIMEVNGKIEAFVDEIKGQSQAEKLRLTCFLNPHPNTVKVYGKEVFARGAYWYGVQDEIFASLIDPLLADASPVIKKMANHFYFHPIRFDLSFDGLKPGKINAQKKELSYKAGVVQRFSKTWKQIINKREQDFAEYYTINITWHVNLNFEKTIQDDIDQQNATIDRRIDNYLRHPTIKRKSVKINIAGVDYIRMGNHKSFWNKNAHGTESYQWSEYLGMRLDNIVVFVDSYGRFRDRNRAARTRQIAEKIVSIIRNSHRGW